MDPLTTSLAGSALGFAGSLVSPIIEAITGPSKRRHQLAMAQQKATQIAQAQTAEERQYVQQAYDKEGDSVRNHEIALNSAPGFIGALQRSVRPVTAYTFLFFYIIFKFVLMYAAMRAGVTAEQFAVVVFTATDAGLLAAILSFYFGQRMVEKARNGALF